MSGAAFGRVYDAVRQIPVGKVSTYGEIARLAGNPRWARVVGYALHSAPEDVPCHRVVNREGGLSDAFQPGGKETHRLLLLAEGVLFCADGSVDLAQCLWDGEAQRKDG